MISLPGLIDVHVHMREPGGEHKETWETGTSAALAGGITAVLAMPNTSPAVVDEETFDVAMDSAAKGARCDYAHWVGATLDNAETVSSLARRAAGIKLYLDQTFGDLRLDDPTVWEQHLVSWPEGSVLAAHAEGGTLQTLLAIAASVGRSVHICHVATAADLDLIAEAKERGDSVTCEVTPHHLFLDAENAPVEGRAEVRPRLASPSDRLALWDRLDVVDCFATDHAPHTLAEKDGSESPPGFPGLQTMLPLLLTAVHDGLLELDDVTRRLHDAPRRIFEMPEQPETWVEVDPDHEWTIDAGDQLSLAGWTPFSGRPVRGRVERVVLRGAVAFGDGKVIAAPGSGRDLRKGDS